MMTVNCIVGPDGDGQAEEGTVDLGPHLHRERVLAALGAVPRAASFPEADVDDVGADEKALEPVVPLATPLRRRIDQVGQLPGSILPTAVDAPHPLEAHPLHDRAPPGEREDRGRGEAPPQQRLGMPHRHRVADPDRHRERADVVAEPVQHVAEGRTHVLHPGEHPVRAVENVE